MQDDSKSIDRRRRRSNSDDRPRVGEERGADSSGTESLSVIIEEGLQSFDQTVGVFELAFPDDKYGPTHSAKFGLNRYITLLIPRELALPIFDTGSGHSSGAASRMDMPEAPVDEDDFGSAGKDYIRTTGQIGSMESISKPAGMEKPSNLALRLGILALDAAHILTSAVWRNIVHPGSLLCRCRFGGKASATRDQVDASFPTCILFYVSTARASLQKDAAGVLTESCVPLNQNAASESY